MEQKNKKLVLTKETISSLSNNQYGSIQERASNIPCPPKSEDCSEQQSCNDSCVGNCGGSQCECNDGRASDGGGGIVSEKPGCDTYTCNTYCGTCNNITCANTCGGGASCVTCDGASACHPDVCTNTFAATCEELTCGLKCDTYNRASCYPCGTVMC